MDIFRMVIAIAIVAGVIPAIVAGVIGNLRNKEEANWSLLVSSAVLVLAAVAYLLSRLSGA